jgi:transposase-like protein
MTKITSQSTSEGQSCPNQACPDYGKIKPDNLIKFGKTRQSVQRLRCKTCGATFTTTHDSLFYRRRARYEDILETLALLAEGVRISSLARAKKVKPDTIRTWLREAALHVEEVQAKLQEDYQLSQTKIDGLLEQIKSTEKKKDLRKTG